jgi:hypothetical protein
MCEHAALCLGSAPNEPAQRGQSWQQWRIDAVRPVPSRPVPSSSDSIMSAQKNRCLHPLTSHTVRLSALVNLYIQPLKGVFLPRHQTFTVQYQFFHTRQPLYPKLHTNYQLLGPHVTHTHTHSSPFFFSTSACLLCRPRFPSTPQSSHPPSFAPPSLYWRSSPLPPSLVSSVSSAGGGGRRAPQHDRGAREASLPRAPARGGAHPRLWPPA